MKKRWKKGQKKKEAIFFYLIFRWNEWTKGLNKNQHIKMPPASPPRSPRWPTAGWGCPSICFWKLPSHVHLSANFQTAFLSQTPGPWMSRSDTKSLENINSQSVKGTCIGFMDETPCKCWAHSWEVALCMGSTRWPTVAAPAVNLWQWTCSLVENITASRLPYPGLPWGKATVLWTVTTS